MIDDHFEPDLPGADLQPREKISPDALLLGDALMHRWEKFTVRLTKCQLELNEENVHDLRVSMRRLLVILILCRAVMPEIKAKSLRREIKSHLDNLDALRDTQVMQVYLNKKFRREEDVTPILTYLGMQEAHLLRQVNNEINHIQVTSMLERILLIEKTMEYSLTGTGIEGQILSVVDEAFMEVRWKRLIINPEDMTSVHAMRIAFKKFRYMLEVAAPLIPSLPPSRLKVLHRYQGLMGDVQDGVVMLGFVDHFSSENPQFDVRPVREVVAQDLKKRMDTFMARIDRIRLFWRKSPTARFPWKLNTTTPPVVS